MTYCSARAISLNQVPMDWSGNVRRMRKSLAATDASFIVFPEMSFSGYGCEDMFLHDWLYQRIESEVMNFLPATKGRVVIAGLPVQFADNNHNAAIVMADEKVLGIYAKRHLANDGLHYEKRWFEPWPVGKKQAITYAGFDCFIGDQSFCIDGLKFAFEICEDAWSENRRVGTLAASQVDLIVNPSASHFALRKQALRRELIIAGAKEFSCQYIYCNLLGNEAGRVIYDGAVFFANAEGLIFESERMQLGEWQGHDFSLRASHSEDAENLALGLLKFTKTEREETTLAPELNESEEFFLAETLGLFDYMRKSYSKGFILSLSGGVDSAACAALVYHMAQRVEHELSVPERQHLLSYFTTLDCNASHQQWMSEILTCVYQATQNSGPVTEKAAESLAAEVGATYYFYDIQSVLDNFHGLTEKALGRDLTWQTDDLALQNIQARVRAPGVWMLANIKGALLLSTSNRSEAAVGYATMDGDTSGGLSPLAGIGKVFLREYLRLVEKEAVLSGDAISTLSLVNAQEPTAELRPQDKEQKDEEDLMPYEVLDRIQKLSVFHRFSPVQIANILQEEMSLSLEKVQTYLDRYFRLWSRNQWKRERYAPAFHLDDESLDPKTWCRFPILNSGFADELRDLRNLKKEK